MSGCVFDIGAAGWIGFTRLQLWLIAIQRRAVGADRLILIAHVDEDVRMIEGRVCADALELLDSDLDGRMPGVVLEMGNGNAGHCRLPFVSSDGMRL